MTAREQLDHIDRYFEKNWMDEDFPTDKIYTALNKLEELEATSPQEGGNLP